MRLFKNSLVLVFVIFFQLRSQAQFLDTLKAVFKNKSSLDLRLESRNSFITNDRALISGIRVGVAFSRKLRFGGGLSWLSSELKQDNYVLNEYNTIVNRPKYLKFGYICYYIDFVFYKTQRWQLSIPIQAGTGMSWFQSSTNYVVNGKEPKYFMILYEPGITVQFKIFKWFGLGADIGYRFGYSSENFLHQKLNSPTYAFKISFWADQLFFELFPKSKITKKWGPTYW